MEWICINFDTEINPQRSLSNRIDNRQIIKITLLYFRRVRARWWCYAVLGDMTQIQIVSYSPTTCLTPVTRTTWPGWVIQPNRFSGSASRWATWKLTTPNMPSSRPSSYSLVFLHFLLLPSDARILSIILLSSHTFYRLLYSKLFWNDQWKTHSVLIWMIQFYSNNLISISDIFDENSFNINRLNEQSFL